MDSLYRGLEDATVNYPDGKLYGKDVLRNTSQERLAKELQYFLTIYKVRNSWKTVTNIVNLHDHLKGYPMVETLTSVELDTLTECLKHKYPDLTHKGMDVRTWSKL
jgi:hypothetical protein